MGWDAHAVIDKNDKNYKQIKKAFKAASNVVSFIYADTVDGYLKHGGLDCSICGKILEAATEASVYNDWTSVEKIKQFNKDAKWDYVKATMIKKDMWAYYSAKFFLRICAKYNLPIHFTY